MNSRENLPMMLPANEIQAIGLDCMGDICVLGYSLMLLVLRLLSKRLDKLSSILYF